MLLMKSRDERFRRDALVPGADHHRRAVGVVRAHVPALVAAHLLEPHPEVGLEVFHEMPQVDVAVGVGKCRGHENCARFFHAMLFFNLNSCVQWTMRRSVSITYFLLPREIAPGGG